MRKVRDLYATFHDNTPESEDHTMKEKNKASLF
jgi:hypothetical protein